MRVGCYMLVLWGILGLAYSQGQFEELELASLSEERNILRSMLQNLRNVQRTTEPALSCTDKYAKISGHTLCLTDSPNVISSGVTEDEKIRIVQKHNSLRASVQPPASDLAMLKWDDKLAAVAQKWAKQCIFEHDKVNSVLELGMSVGQNMAKGHSNWQEAIQDWYDEIKDYQYGVDPELYLYSKQIGHFTQNGRINPWKDSKLISIVDRIHGYGDSRFNHIVQSGTYLVGCGFAECSSSFSSRNDRYYVCNYASGQTKASQINPYTAGTRCGKCPNNCNNGLCDCGGRVCLNGGKMNVGTCTCECPKLYKGDSCEILNCPARDSDLCGSQYPKSDCIKYSNVPRECPYMCGICSGGPAYTTIKTAHGCQFTGQRADAATCNKYGDNGMDKTACETRGGTFGCSDCIQYSNVKTEYCPVMCGLCDAPCNGKKCNNGGTLDTNTCSCSCKQFYSGDNCETVNCPAKDDDVCGQWFKSDCYYYSNVPPKCPHMCGICSGKSSSSSSTIY